MCFVESVCVTRICEVRIADCSPRFPSWFAVRVPKTPICMMQRTRLSRPPDRTNLNTGLRHAFCAPILRPPWISTTHKTYPLRMSKPRYPTTMNYICIILLAASIRTQGARLRVSEVTVLGGDPSTVNHLNGESFQQDALTTSNGMFNKIKLFHKLTRS